MFKVIADEHREKQRLKKQQMAEMEKKIIDQSISSLSDAVFEETTQGTAEIIENQKKISQKCKDVRESWKEFNNEIVKWTEMINKLDSAVKEIGDIRSWSIQIQSEVQAAVETLDNKSP